MILNKENGYKFLINIDNGSPVPFIYNGTIEEAFRSSTIGFETILSTHACLELKKVFNKTVNFKIFSTNDGTFPIEIHFTGSIYDYCIKVHAYGDGSEIYQVYIETIIDKDHILISR